MVTGFRARAHTYPPKREYISFKKKKNPQDGRKFGIKVFKPRHAWALLYSLSLSIYVSKCSASIQIPHSQTVLTKHIEVAALGHKM